MSKPSIEQLLRALRRSWGPDTCFSDVEWTPENPARGQCVVSSLVVQKYLGGELQQYEVSAPGLAEKHYCNILPDGTILDTTGAQYKTSVTLRATSVNLKGFASVREKRLAEDATRSRYELLLSRVEVALGQV